MSRFLLPIACLIVLSATGRADEKPKPNTLTPKEIADGWILLFDGETTFGWKIDGASEVKDGVLILGKGKKTVAYPTTNFDYYRVEMEWKGHAKIFHQYHQVSIGDNDPIDDIANWGSSYFFNDRVAGRGAIGQGTTGGLSRLDDVKVQRQELRSTPFLIETDGKTEVRLRSFKLRPLQTKPLFNGKDLDGWKLNQADPKRVATKFEVTKDGELSAKNGPGDLQTEKQFDDFVLQFECKTNGKFLNSGIFFRCMPDAYQNGYEAQIQNAYLGEDRTKPIDYGTGAIYRRIAARKVVSNDNEWFTMTVAARGAHFATWVNGYQTVDWTDDRKANDNPRQGLRTEKGHLSIQGHDPTTDLLFRNIRIAELPK